MFWIFHCIQELLRSWICNRKKTHLINSINCQVHTISHSNLHLNDEMTVKAKTCWNLMK
jgi:hypothetical protein